MKRFFKYMLIFILWLFTGCTSRYADKIILAKRVYTLNPEKPIAEAVAVKGFKIIAVGLKEDVENYIGPGTKIIDVGESFVYPGFVDAHLHLEWLGEVLNQVDLVGARSLEEVRERLINKSAELEPGEWLFGHGWDQNDWDIQEFPTRWDIDDIAAGHPILLERIAGHAILVNSRALEMAGIDRNTPSPAGGEILRREDGEPTGVLLDNAQSLLWRIVPERSRDRVRENILLAMKHCASFGLTQVHAMSVGKKELSVLKELDREGKMLIRVYAVPDGESLLGEILENGMYIGGENAFLSVRAVKFYIDGAMGSRGALLFEPYSDDPGNKGLNVTAEDDFLDMCNQAENAGFQVCTHAIGDSGNHIVLEAYHRLLGKDAEKYRWRVEHAQVISDQDITRFYEYGIIPSMQPTHATSDMYWAEDRLGKDRVKGAYAWRRLLDTGVIIPGGSDAPVEFANPVLGIYAAITRQDTSGYPEGGWHPDQCMTREEALKSFTEWADYAAFQENFLGHIESGRWADLSVFDRDLMQVPPEKIVMTKAVLTIVGGEVVYENYLEGVK